MLLIGSWKYKPTCNANDRRNTPKSKPQKLKSTKVTTVQNNEKTNPYFNCSAEYIREDSTFWLACSPVFGSESSENVNRMFGAGFSCESSVLSSSNVVTTFQIFFNLWFRLWSRTSLGRNFSNISLSLGLVCFRALLPSDVISAISASASDLSVFGCCAMRLQRQHPLQPSEKERESRFSLKACITFKESWRSCSDIACHADLGILYLPLVGFEISERDWPATNLPPCGWNFFLWM